MTIASSDLKLRASERMADDLSTALGVGGGGRLGTAVIAGTVENDVFPDVMPAERISGTTHLRKVWVSPMSDENDSLLNSAAGLVVRPTDTNCRVGLFRAVGADLMWQALNRLRTADHLTDVSMDQATGRGTNSITLNIQYVVPAIGEIIAVLRGASPAEEFRVVVGVSGQTVTYSGADVTDSTGIRTYKRNPAGPGFASVSLSTASSGSTSVAVDRLEERFEQTSSTNARGGAQFLYYAGDQVVVQHGTTDTTREYATVLRVDYLNNVLHFTAALANSYPSGSKVFRMIPTGNLKAAVTLAPFSQQTWARTWSDTVTTPTSATYSGAIGLINAGAVTDRWAVVFSSPTAFDLISERRGQLASGTTASDFAPVNPATNQPYFTLYAASWGGGWIPGNCVRFNTEAAAGPVWVSRCVLPSSAAGTVNATIVMKGDVNA